MNRVILLGNLTKDVELKQLSSGMSVGKTSIATNRKKKNPQTGKYDINEVMFIELTIWGKTAEMVQRYFRRGSKILVEGFLSFDQWTDQQGNKRSKHSVTVENVEFVESKGDSNNQSQYNQQQNGGYNNNNGNNYGNQQNNGNYQQPQNNYPQQNNGNYSQPQQSQQNSLVQPPIQQTQPQAPQPKEEVIPVLDVNEDQIPF
jgi:single-strand DNA-binding protein